MSSHAPDPSPRYVPAKMDVDHLAALRQNICTFLERTCMAYSRPGDLVLDVAPQENGGAARYFPGEVTVETLDIDPAAGCSFTADLCATNSNIPSDRYDVIVCTEVLEHTLQPFLAVNELFRLLKPGAVLLVSTPFNFRIHGPLPDCWRFTEHGLRALFAQFKLLHLTPLETPERPLMPIQYTVEAQKPLSA
jgi:hypothetical protein